MQKRKPYSLLLPLLLPLLFFTNCTQQKKPTDKQIPHVAFLDFVDDGTLAKARQGFIDALTENGFIKDSNYVWDYLNAQGDQPTLIQACQSLLSKKPELIATCPTLASITAVQNTKTTPVFMMVSPSPDDARLLDKSGKAPANLFGVYETLGYIDTSVTMIKTLLPKIKSLGVIYNQSEQQSVNAYDVVKAACERNDIELKSLPVNNSSESQLVTQALLNKGVDAFFAMPDNVIFQSFETIVESCNKANVPVFTSEAGLVSRGAVAGYGADMYSWGHQAGEQAAQLLKTKTTTGLHPEAVKIRKRVYNEAQAKKFGIVVDASFEKM
ncbi:MAG: ABC transporter substrate-binding protein [Bacteroidia bacterium]